MIAGGMGVDSVQPSGAVPEGSPEMRGGLPSSARMALSDRARWWLVSGLGGVCLLWWVATLVAGWSPRHYLPDNGAGWGVLRAASLQGRPVVLPLRLAKNLARDQQVDVDLVLPVGPGLDAAAPLGLCVPRWALSAEVRLDGALMRRPMPGLSEVMDYTRPHFVALPAGLAPGGHALQIRVHAWPGMDPGLSEVWYGNGDLLGQACGRLSEHRRAQAHASVFMLAATGLMSALMALLFRSPAAGWYALMALVWSLHARHLSAPDLPWTVDAWVRVFFASRVLFVPPMVLFCLAVAGVRTRGLAWGLAGVWAVALGSLWALPPSMRSTWMAVVGGLAVAVVLATLVWLLRWTWRSRLLHAPLLTLAFSLAIVANLMDFSRWMGRLDYGVMSMAFSAVPLVLVSFVAWLIERLLQHRRREVEVRELLRAEIARHRARIAADFEDLAVQRERLLVMEERRRLVQDMHDVVGSQLLSATVLLKAPTAGPAAIASSRALIERALLDLRCTLDVMSLEEPDGEDPDDDLLGTLLGTLRWRMASVFEAAGMALHWHCAPLPPDLLGGGRERDRRRAELMRLLLEALTNVLRHSNARAVHLHAGPDGEGRVEIRVEDDGVGMPRETVGGLGLRGMHRRAEALGARLQIGPGVAGGTCVRLSWART